MFRTEMRVFAGGEHGRAILGEAAMTANVEAFVLRMKRPDTDFFRTARKLYDTVTTASMPVPNLVKPLGRMVYEFRFLVPTLWKRLKAIFYTTPLFRCRCEVAGERLKVFTLPVVKGHTAIFLGDDVKFSGAVGITSGKFRQRPTLRIGDRSFIGHNVSITCNEEVTIEEDVLVASNCRISDYDGHPKDRRRRVANFDPEPEDIRPVRICSGAWIGFGTTIMKGVTIGEGAVVGANSVVTRDVPPFSVVAGSPAKVVKASAEAMCSAHAAAA
jgi:acetyltransferase-like isoleucine patch superfamily enzyme